MASQIIYMRELLTVFYGNELSISFILAGWLLAVIVPWPAARWPTLAMAATVGVMLLAVSSGGSSVVRNRIMIWLAPIIRHLS